MGILCYDLVEGCRPFMVIENVIVANEARGKGVETRLIQQMEEITKKNEVSYIMFVSSLCRKETHVFYQTMRYELDKVKGFKKIL